MKRRGEWLVLVLSVAMSSIGIVLSRGQRPPEPIELAATEGRLSGERSGATPSIHPSTSPSGDVEVAESREDPGLERFRSVWPRPARVREEVREDPHQVPSSLLAFARILGAQLEHAHSDPEFSLELLSSLEDCVRSTEVIEAARAVCLRQARRIPGFHPDDTRLPIAAARVHEAAPKRVLDIADAVDS
jgi:hypothetical protein